MNFDLNIENYSKGELIEMFELPKQFDKNIIERQETKLKDSILKNKEISKDTQKKTIDFITKAKNSILNSNDQTDENGSGDLLKNIYGLNNNLKQSKIQEVGDHMIETSSDTPFVYSNPSAFFPGIINPIKKRVVQKVLNIYKQSDFK